MSHDTASFMALQNAMERDTPECRDLDLFIADDLLHGDRAVLESICEACPVKALCREYATASAPPAGFWAGRPASYYRKRGNR